MVAPSWESFQRPNQRQAPQVQNEEEEDQKQEYAQEVPGQIKDEEKPEPKQPNWGDFQSPSTYQGEPDPTADEGMFSYLLRGSVRTASRVAEQVAGAYGNVEQFLKDTLVSVPQTGGLIGWAISEYVGPERWERLVRGSPHQQHQLFPTSKQFKQASEALSGGYTSPKTKGEKEYDELIEDVGSTIRGRPTGSVRQMLVNHLGIPIAANATKKIVNDLGFGEDKANLAKMAVWFPLSLANNVNGPAYASQLMNQGRNGFNPNLTANVPAYQNRVNQVSRNMLNGDPRSALARQQLAGIEQDLANGQTSMRDLMTRYDAINAAKRDKGLFELNARDRGAAIRNINEVRDVVREQITHLGQSNPQALRDWQNGVQAWATIHRSNAITNWVQGVAKGPYAKILTGPAAALFGVGTYGAASSPLISGPLAAASGASYKTGQVLYRIWNDPRLANYYWNAVNAAMEQNVPTFINNYNRLNDELEKDERKKSKKTNDKSK